MIEKAPMINMKIIQYCDQKKLLIIQMEHLVML